MTPSQLAFTYAGIWRCAMPRAPRQLPSLPPPNLNRREDCYRPYSGGSVSSISLRQWPTRIVLGG
jgi:hypothetical protein